MPKLTENIYQKLLSSDYRFACIIDFIKTNTGHRLTIKPITHIQDTERGCSITALTDPIIHSLVSSNNGNIDIEYIL